MGTYMISINVGDYCEVCWMRPFFKITWINSYPVIQNSTLKWFPGKVKFAVRIGFSSNKPSPFLGPLCIVCSWYWEGKENRAAQPQQNEPYQQYKQTVPIIQTLSRLLWQWHGKCFKIPLADWIWNGPTAGALWGFLCGETQFYSDFSSPLGWQSSLAFEGWWKPSVKARRQVRVPDWIWRQSVEYILKVFGNALTNSHGLCISLSFAVLEITKYWGGREGPC